MKKSVMLVLCILMGMLFVASMAFASPGGTGIKGTPHDLSSIGQGAAYGSGIATDAKDRICVYCHAPHNTVKAADAAGIAYTPLWNHAVTNQTYVMYSNGTELPNDLAHQSQAMQLLAGKNRPGGVSRLCLSCHDGTVSTNAYGWYGATSTDKGSKYITAGSPFLIGGAGDLSNHHPIGFSYDAAQANDGGLAVSSTPLTGNGAFASKTIKQLLWNGNMECTTCHDVHNTGNATDADKFLWKADNQSAFCLTCHLKGVKAP